MRFLLSIALVLHVAIPTNTHSLVMAESNNQPRLEKVFKVGSDVTAPVLAPVDYSTILRTDCQQTRSGDVQLSLIVDHAGKARDVYFTRPQGDSLDSLAVGVVAADRFTPGTRDGNPVAVAMLVDVKLEGCAVAETSDTGKSVLREHLRSAPLQTASPAENVPSNLLLDDTTPPTDPACQEPSTGNVEFAAIVDTSGNPRSVFPTRPAGNELDPLASAIVARDRFKPGEKDGTAVPVAITIAIQLEACKVNETDPYGNVNPKIKLRKQPVQQIGQSKNFEPERLPIAALFGDSDTHLSPAKPHSSTIAPVPISTPEAKYTAEARMKQIQGVCLIKLIVNAYGNPQNIRVVRSLGYGLDDAAIEAVRSYRFKPAMKDGHPVAIPMTVEVRFRL